MLKNTQYSRPAKLYEVIALKSKRLEKQFSVCKKTEANTGQPFVLNKHKR